MLEKTTMIISFICLAVIVIMTIVNIISYNYFYVSFSACIAVGMLSLLLNAIIKFKAEKSTQTKKLIALFSVALFLDLATMISKILK